MEYSHEERVNAQQLRIIFAVYKQGWEDAIQALRAGHSTHMRSVESTIAWLNEVPAPRSNKDVT